MHNNSFSNVIYFKFSMSLCRTFERFWPIFGTHAPQSPNTFLFQIHSKTWCASTSSPKSKCFLFLFGSFYLGFLVSAYVAAFIHTHVHMHACVQIHNIVSRIEVKMCSFCSEVCMCLVSSVLTVQLFHC